MNRAHSLHQRWRGIEVANAPQVLACVNCVLLEWEHDDLSAPYWRWYCNDRPGAWLILPDARIPIEPGRVVLIPPHTSVGTGCRGPVGHLYVHFALGLDRTATPGRVFQHTPSPSLRAMIKRLAALSEEGKGAASSLLETTFLVQAILNASLASIPRDYWEARFTDARIVRALDLLGQNTVAVDNETLARAAGMNTNAFIRKFLQATGHTPHQYCLRLRIERAAGWLREGRMSIDEVASAAGFCDRFHFSRVFKQVLGSSPGSYRRKQPASGS